MADQGTADTALNLLTFEPLNSEMSYSPCTAKFFGVGSGTEATAQGDSTVPISETELTELSTPKMSWGIVT